MGVKYGISLCNGMLQAAALNYITFLLMCPEFFLQLKHMGAFKPTKYSKLQMNWSMRMV